MNMSQYSKRDTRTIVDPSAWESTEVGCAESIAFQSHETVKKSKVSSMRSSLFKKNAKKGNETDQETQTFQHSLVFQQAADADAIRTGFSFEGRKALNYCQFGKANKKMWPKDVLGFFHNAIRYELHDLMTILRELQRIGPKLTVKHFVNVRIWWQTCSAIMLDYLDMEVRVLEPWIAIALDGYNGKRGGDEAVKLFQKMPQRQEGLRRLFDAIDQAFCDVCDGCEMRNSAGESGRVDVKSLSQKTMILLGSLDAFVVDVGDYMCAQEEHFCGPLNDKYKSMKKEREVMMGKGVKHFVKKGRKRDFMLVLLTRWMGDNSVMVGNVTKLIEELHDCDFDVITARFENSHANLVKQLSCARG